MQNCFDLLLGYQSAIGEALREHSFDQSNCEHFRTADYADKLRAQGISVSLDRYIALWDSKMPISLLNYQFLIPSLSSIILFYVI
jgi:hypothetical protein